MKKQPWVSLRNKLLALLSLLPIAFLAAYLAMATNLFYQDKKAYVFDSSVFNARSLSTQIKMELSSYERILNPIINSLDYTNLKMSARANYFFNEQKNIEHLLIYKNQRGSKFYKISVC